MEQKIKALLLENCTSLFGTTISEGMIQFQPTRKDVAGDLTLVVFPFVKLLRCKPEDAGQKIGAPLSYHNLPQDVLLWHLFLPQYFCEY